MELRYEVKGDCAIFYIGSNIELFVADDLKDAIFKEIETNKFTKVILNLDAVDFMDSMGIAMLLQIKELSNPKVELRICNVHNSIHRLFEVTNLYKLIPVDNTENDSIKKLI